jgi:hypothetical protein
MALAGAVGAWYSGSRRGQRGGGLEKDTGALRNMENKNGEVKGRIEKVNAGIEKHPP